MSNPLLEAALAYEQRGWSVIPIAANGSKKPLLATWERYQKKRATPGEIKAWWTTWPSANIAIVTGAVSGIFALDVDPRHGGEAGPILDAAPTEAVSVTGSGGNHLLYRLPGDGLPNRVGVVAGIDVRAEGGYIIAPPSVHGNGDGYWWEVLGEPAEMPAAMVASIRRPPDKQTKDGDAPKWVEALLSEGAPDGERNDSATKLAGYFQGKGIPRDITYTMVRDWNESKNYPALSEREIRTTVDSVYRTAARRDQRSDRVALPERERLTFVPLSAYMAQHGQAETTWIVNSWLPSATIAFLVAAPESYKTWMLLDLIVSIASGRDFLGLYEVHEPGPVMLFQQEDYHGGIAERIGAIVGSKFGLAVEEVAGEFVVSHPPELPIYVHPDRALRFDSPALMAELEKAVAEIRPRLVVIDPLYSAAGGTDDYMAQAVQHMFKLKELRDKYGTSFIVAHHTKKSSSGTTAREDGWGSQFLNAFLETGWQIRRVADAAETITVRRHFKTTKSKEETQLHFDIDTETLPYRYRVTTTNPDASETNDRIVKLLMEKYPLTASAIAQELGKERSYIGRKLRELESDRVVFKDAKKAYYLATDRPEY